MPIVSTPTYVGSSYANTASGSTATVSASIPAGSSVGDTMVTIIGTVSATVTTPSGWTLLGSTARGGTSSQVMLTKVIGASEPTPTFALSAASNAHSITVVTYSGVGSVSGYQVLVGTTGNPKALPTVTTDLPNSAVLYSAYYAKTSPATTTTYSSGVNGRTDDGFVSSGGAGLGITVADFAAPSPTTVSGNTLTFASVTSMNEVRAAVLLRPIQAPDLYTAPSFVASSTGNNIAGSSTVVTAPVPTGTIAGDMMVAAVNTNAATVDTPSGWVFVGQQLRTGTSWLYLFARRATDSESTPTFTASAAALNHAVTINSYRNVGGIGDFSGATAGTSTSNTMPTVSIKYGNSLVFSVAYWAKSSNSSPATHAWTGATERSEDLFTAGGNGYSFSSADMVVADYPGPSGTVTDTYSVAPTNTAYMSLVLRPITSLPSLVGMEQSGQASTTTGSFAINLPPATQVGDVVVVGLSYARSTATASSVVDPAGWTVLMSQNSSDSSSGYRVYARAFASGDPTTLTVANGASAQYGWNGIAYSYRGADFGTMVYSTLNNTASTASHVIPGVTTTTADNLVLAIMGFGQSASTITATWPSDIDKDAYTQRQAGTSRFVYINTASTVQRYPGSFGSRTVTLSSSSGPQAAIMLAIPPLLNSTLSDSDSATATEDASTTAVVSNSDSGAAADSASSIVVDGAVDSGVGSESSSIVATEDDLDTATGTETASVSAQINDGDTAVVTEGAYVSNTIQDTDSAAADEDSGVSVDLSDSASGSDTASVDAQVPVADAAAAAEDTPGIVPTIDPDAATAADSAGVSFAVSDDAAATEAASVTTANTGTDAAVATESATVTVTAAGDSANWNEAATRSVSGKLVAPRVYSIEKDTREYRVPREVRVLAIAREYREYRIMSESLVDNNL